MGMVPKTYPAFPERQDIDVYGTMTPAKEVGGDLYDFLIRDNCLYFCIGDVSGKGIPAALVMAVTRSLFRTVSAHEKSPQRIVTSINDSMSDMNESNMFVTFFVGVLDMTTGVLRYCNAGHNAPLLLHDGAVKTIDVKPNLPLGVVVETNASFSPRGVQPVCAGPLPKGVDSLVHRVVYGQQLTLEAAITGNYDLALKAFQNDANVCIAPDKSRELFERMLENTKAYLPFYDKWVKNK